MSMMQPGWEQQAYATMGQEFDGKMDPVEAGYRDAEDPERVCGECMNFLPPDQCQVVAGKVSEAGVCDQFSGEQEAPGEMMEEESD